MPFLGDGKKDGVASNKRFLEGVSLIHVKQESINTTSLYMHEDLIEYIVSLE